MALIQVIFLLEPPLTPVRTYGLASNKEEKKFLDLSNLDVPPPTSEGKSLHRGSSRATLSCALRGPSCSDNSHLSAFEYHTKLKLELKKRGGKREEETHKAPLPLKRCERLFNFSEPPHSEPFLRALPPLNPGPSGGVPSAVLQVDPTSRSKQTLKVPTPPLTRPPMSLLMGLGALFDY